MQEIRLAAFVAATIVALVCAAIVLVDLKKGREDNDGTAYAVLGMSVMSGVIVWAMEP